MWPSTARAISAFAAEVNRRYAWLGCALVRASTIQRPTNLRPAPFCTNSASRFHQGGRPQTRSQGAARASVWASAQSP
eukprot:9302269-Alexandrium_andersonii.AAC.1